MSEGEEYIRKYLRFQFLLDKGNNYLDECSPQEHLNEILEDLRKLDQTQLGKNQALSLVNTHLPKFVKILLDRKYFNLEPQIYLTVNNFFKEVLLFCIRHLSREYFGLLDVLRRVFNDEKLFYDNRFNFHSSETDSEIQEVWETEIQNLEVEVLPTSPQFAKMQTFSTVSVLFSYNIYVFGVNGGFKRLLEFVSEHSSLEHINKVLYLTILIRDSVYQSFWRNLVKDLRKVVINTILDLTDEELRVTQKQDLVNLIKYLESLLEKIYSDEKVGKILESFELELSMKCLNSPYLEKRIYGISEIIEKITYAKNKDEEDQKVARGIYTYQYSIFKTAKWLNSAALLEWIDRQNLFEIIFGPRSHPQIVMRSAELIKFLYTNSRFTRDNIDVIWNSAAGKHEAEREALINLIQEVVSCFSPQDLQYFFSKLTSLPFPEIDSQILSLVKSLVKQMSNLCKAPRRTQPEPSLLSPWADDNDFTNKSEFVQVPLQEEPIPMGPPQYVNFNPEIHNEEDTMSTAPEEHENPENIEFSQALEFIWSLWQEEALDSGVPEDIAKTALEALQDLLTIHFRAERVKFLLRCIENVRKNSVVLFSCQLMEQILSSYNASRIANSLLESKQHMIKWLEREQHLITELFNSLLVFKREAVEEAERIMGEEKPQEDVDSYSTCSEEEEDALLRRTKYESLFNQICVSKDNKLNYIQEIKARLEFLKFLYSNSSETLHPRHAQVMWEMMVLNAVTESEQNEYFNWMCSVLSNWLGDYNAIDDDVIHLIFTDMILKLDPRYLTFPAFQCFDKFFININKQHGLLYKYEFDDEIDVKDIDLLGMKALWEVVLQARDEVVFKEALSLLERLYIGLRKCSEEDQECFLRQCMEQLKEGSDQLRQAETQDAVNRVSRAVLLLNDFIQEFEGKGQPKLKDKGTPVEVVINNMTANAQAPKSFKVTLFSEMPILDAKKLIASKLNPPFPLGSLQMFSSGKILDYKQDNKTVEEAKLGQKIMVTTGEEEWGMPGPEDLEFEKQEKLTQLKSIFQDLEENLLTLALNKSVWNLEEAADLLMDEFSRQNLQKQLMDSRKASQPKVETYRLSSILSNTHQYFNLLFDLLELGNPSVNSLIWNLLNKIPVNQYMFENIKKLNIVNQEDWDRLLDSSCMYKLLYSLQIVNSFVSGSESNSSPEEVEERQAWRTKFLELGGFEHLYNILMSAKLSQNSQDCTAKCIGLLLGVLKLFIQATLLNQPCEQLQSIFTPFISSESMTLEFPNLIRQMSEDAGKKVMEVIHFPAFISKLLEIVEISINISSLESVQSSLDLLLPMIVFKPELLPDLYNRSNFNNLIASTLLTCSCSEVRESIKATFGIVAESVEELPESIQLPKHFFLETLLAKLPTGQNPYCHEFFELVNKLLELCCYKDEGLLEVTKNFIESREMVESRHLKNQDHVLTGYLKITSSLVSQIPYKKQSLQEFLSYIYNCLFEIPEVAVNSSQNSPPKYKSEETRKAGFQLLLKLSEDCPENSSLLLNQLYLNHSQNNLYYYFEPDISTRSGLVGLKNFGCTCYMNSLMQQFFMMPQMRNGILDAKIQVQDFEEAVDPENLLYQTQLVFANLLESEKQFYSPIGFCKAFKGYDGEPMDVHVQQDVDEFFNLLCDKLEDLLRPTKYSKLLRSHLGGTLVHEILSCESELPYRGEREEQFMRLSLEIKNKKNLQEALDLYIKEDVLDGDNKYFCEQYNQKITAKKRCLINSLSNTVVVHLKRFEFDFTRMQRIKVNDYCEFPMNLNFKPWTKDGVMGTNEKPDDYYEFELVGVLVHSGVADAGHYYSFIKDRSSKVWYRFDDRNVEVFNPENLKEECFGGEGNLSWGYGVHIFEKTKNAYMLIYERVNPFPTEDLDEEGPAEGCKLVAKTQEIFQNVWNENMMFLRDLLFFDSSYFKLIKSFVEQYQFEPVLEVTPQMSDSENFIQEKKLTEFMLEDETRMSLPPQSIMQIPELQQMYSAVAELISEVKTQEERDEPLKLIKLATLFGYEMLIRARNTTRFIEWIPTLSELYKKHAPACLWFLKYLTSNSAIVEEILLNIRDSEVRRAFGELLESILVLGSEYEVDLLFEECKIFDTQNLPRLLYLNSQQVFVYKSKAASGRFVELLFSSLLKEAKKNWRKFDEFFSVINKFVNYGAMQAKFVIEKDGITSLLKFFMNGEYPFGTEKHIMGDQVTEPDMAAVLEILCTLVCTSLTEEIISSGKYTETCLFKESPLKTQLSEVAKSYFQDYRVFRNLLKYIRHQAVTRITLHLSYNNLGISVSFIEEVCNLVFLNKMNWNEVNPYLKLLSYILNLDDDVKEARVFKFFELQLETRGLISASSNFFDMLYRYKDVYLMFTIVVTIWWSDMLGVPHVFGVAMQEKAKYRWILLHIQSINSRLIPHPSFVDCFGRVRFVSEELSSVRNKLTDWVDSDSESSVEMELLPDQSFDNNQEEQKADDSTASEGEDNVATQ